LWSARAGCLRRDGIVDPELRKAAVDEWLGHKVGHKLQPLAERLDELLGRLRNLRENLRFKVHREMVHQMRRSSLFMVRPMRMRPDRYG
jgi:hypothetical protein